MPNYRTLPLFTLPRCEALVSGADYDRVEGYRWHLSSSGYVVACVGGRASRKNIYLHRLVLNAGSSQMVDHRNGDKLDNRRENLRFCTRAENVRNSIKAGSWKPRGLDKRQRKIRDRVSGESCYKGVSKVAATGLWRAYCTVEGRQKHLGCFATEKEAAHAYNVQASVAFGEFARLNDVSSVKLNPINNSKSAGQSGYVGVKICRGKFVARAKVNGREHYLGVFASALAAHQARKIFLKKKSIRDRD